MFVLTSCQGPRVWRACPMATSMLRLGDSPAGVAPTRFRESAEYWVNVGATKRAQLVLALRPTNRQHHRVSPIEKDLIRPTGRRARKQCLPALIVDECIIIPVRNVVKIFQ